MPNFQTYALKLEFRYHVKCINYYAWVFLLLHVSSGVHLQAFPLDKEYTKA